MVPKIFSRSFFLFVLKMKPFLPIYRNKLIYDEKLLKLLRKRKHFGLAAKVKSQRFA